MAMQDSRWDSVAKTRRKFTLQSQILIASFAVALLILAGCGEDPMAPRSEGNPSESASAGFDSPQAVFEAARKATADKEWGELFDTYTPDSQDRLVGDIAYGAAMMTASPDKGDEIKSILQKHGIDASKLPEKPSMTDIAKLPTMFKDMAGQQAQWVAALDDKRAFFVEIMSAFGEFQPGFGQANAKLTDVEITDDTAVGYQEVSVSGNSIRMPVLFSQIDGAWYLGQPTAEESQEIGRNIGKQIGRKFSDKKNAGNE